MSSVVSPRSRLWYALAFLWQFPFLYWALRHDDPVKAKWCLIIGCASIFLEWTLFSYLADVILGVCIAWWCNPMVC